MKLLGVPLNEIKRGDILHFIDSSGIVLRTGYYMPHGSSSYFWICEVLWNNQKRLLEYFSHTNNKGYFSFISIGFCYELCLQ